MLTQKQVLLLNFKQYTIYPINEKKANETAKNLYQKVKIEDNSLDPRLQCLDLLCFQNLFPYVENGQ